MNEQNDALQRMYIQLQQWKQCSDRRAVFLECYSMMTANMLRAIDAGEFHDALWVRHLLEHFAAYYFNALQAYEQEDSQTPHIWRQTFDCARQQDSQALQNLLLGVNAHINYDLVLAVSDLLEPEWSGLDEPARRRRYEDHCHVNEIIARTVDAVQNSVLEPGNLPMQLVDVVFGRVDEWLISRLITGWREQVWEQAVQRISAPDADVREAQRFQVEMGCMRLSQRILLRG